MIFAAIGTQHPFDRLVKMIDAVAPELGEPVIAQTLRGQYHPEHITTFDFVAPDEFRRYIEQARVIVAHAGMGVILTAMEHNKPVIVCPRKASMGEDINDHQLATTARMNEMGYVYVAEDEDSLRRLLCDPALPPLHRVGPAASQSLLDDLTAYIDAL